MGTGQFITEMVIQFLVWGSLGAFFSMGLFVTNMVYEDRPDDFGYYLMVTVVWFLAVAGKAVSTYIFYLFFLPVTGVDVYTVAASFDGLLDILNVVYGFLITSSLLSLLRALLREVFGSYEDEEEEENQEDEEETEGK